MFLGASRHYYWGVYKKAVQSVCRKAQRLGHLGETFLVGPNPRHIDMVRHLRMELRAAAKGLEEAKSRSAHGRGLKGWTKSISHRSETLECLPCKYQKDFPWFLRCCEIDFVHPQSWLPERRNGKDTKQLEGCGNAEQYGHMDIASVDHVFPTDTHIHNKHTHRHGCKHSAHHRHTHTQRHPRTHTATSHTHTCIAMELFVT